MSESDLSIAQSLAEKFVEGREILEKYKYIVDVYPDGIAICSTYGQLIYCNQTYLKLVGCDSLSQVIGDNWVSIISDEDRSRVIGGWQKYLSNKVEKFYAVVEYKNLKTNEKFKKKVLSSKIFGNGYFICLKNEDYPIDPELGFIEAVFP